MDLDEQIRQVEEQVAAGWRNTSVPAVYILASLRELKELKAKCRVMGCGYCGARVYEYGHDDPEPHEHETALVAFAEHDRQCPCNPLARELKRLREAVNEAMQRANESGAGEAGAVDTIHAMHGILSAELKESPDGQ